RGRAPPARPRAGPGAHGQISPGHARTGAAARGRARGACRAHRRARGRCRRAPTAAAHTGEVVMEYKTIALDRWAVKDAGTGSFSGYASTWSVDLQHDRIEPGAFHDTLPQFLHRGVINWAHNWDMPIGTVADAHEDTRGLWIDCDFHSDARSQDARTW